MKWATVPNTIQRFWLMAMLLVLALPVSAESIGWRVIHLSGAPQYQAVGSTFKPLSSGAVLEQGTVIRTAAQDAVTLLHGQDLMALQGDSELTLGDTDSAKTVIRQSRGEALFKVQKLGTRHFTVETPYMIAGVKGTTFAVKVQGNNASTLLFEGRVAIENRASGVGKELLPGRYMKVAEGQRDLEEGAIPAQERNRWQIREQEMLGQMSGADATQTKQKSGSDDAPDYMLGAPLIGGDFGGTGAATTTTSKGVAAELKQTTESNATPRSSSYTMDQPVPVQNSPTSSIFDGTAQSTTPDNGTGAAPSSGTTSGTSTPTTPTTGGSTTPSPTDLWGTVQGRGGK